MVKIEISGRPRHIVILRLRISSQFITPFLAQIQLTEWAGSDGMLYRPEYQLIPTHALIGTGGNASFTLSINIPDTNHQFLQGNLILLGFEEMRIPLILTLQDKPQEPADRLPEYFFHLTLPLKTQSNTPDEDSYHIPRNTLKVMAGLASLEILPAKWVVSELILLLCARGRAFSRTEEGAALLQKLSFTRFFKNISLVLKGAQIPEWIMLAYAIVSGLANTAGKKETGVLQTWDEWLLNLVGQDLESADFTVQDIHSHLTGDIQKTIGEMGNDSEKWAAFFSLGLAHLSPRYMKIMQQVSGGISPDSNEANKPKKRKAKNVLDESGSITR